MSTQLKPLPDNQDWKEKYLLALNEFSKKEKNWSEEEGGLYKSILRLIFSHTGLDEDLDQQLSDMRDRLRQEPGNQARKRIINPVVENIVQLTRNRDGAEKASSTHLNQLLENIKFPPACREQLKSLQQSLHRPDKENNLASFIDQLAALVNDAINASSRSERIQLKNDDPLTVLLEGLSLPGEPGIEIMHLRKRATEIEEEQERIELIQDLVSVLTRAHGRGDNEDSAVDTFPHLKDTLLELFEWLSIPEDYSKKVENLKARINSLQSDPDLSAVLRDTAIILNDLQEAMQLELSDIQDFLSTVTARLEDVEGCFRDVSVADTDSFEQATNLNRQVENNIQQIRNGIVDSKNVGEIKQAIESRLVIIEQCASGFLQSAQNRQQQWAEKVKELNTRLRKMKGESKKLHVRIQEEYKRAKTDALTGSANRLAYNEKIKHEFARWQRKARPLCLCVIDVDKFKGVNDTYGHKAGDKVLKTIAGVCAAKVRKVDFFARYGGEEFVLLLPETELEQARLVAEHLRSEIETCKFHYANKPVKITISCGLAEFTKDDDPETVFKRADKALYAAKQNGRNQVVLM